MSAIDTDRFRTALLEERRRVLAAIQNLHEDHPGSISDETGEDAVFDNHLADTATETYDRELDYTLEENSEHVLAGIDVGEHVLRVLLKRVVQLTVVRLGGRVGEMVVEHRILTRLVRDGTRMIFVQVLDGGQHAPALFE